MGFNKKKNYYCLWVHSRLLKKKGFYFIFYFLFINEYIYIIKFGNISYIKNQYIYIKTWVHFTVKKNNGHILD